MSFLTPLFVLGALAVAAPILFHLIRRTSKERIPFSSLMFLQPTPPRVTRKSRLENILLLLLRCAVLCLLALAFARPFFKKPLNAAPGGGAVTRTVILLDTSASMRRDTLFSDAVARALEITGKAEPNDQVAVISFDRQPRTALPFREWLTASPGERRTLAEQRLRGLKPTWNSTHLGNALIAANEAFDAERDHVTAERRIVVITDQQEGARLDGLQGLPWPKQTHVSLIPLKPKHPANAGVQLLTQATAGKPGEGTTAESVRVRVVNSSESKREQFELKWSGSTSNPTSLYVPPGQSRMVELNRAKESDHLTLFGDEENFDNSLFAITPPRERIGVTFVGDDDETDPQQLLFYLKRAFPETQRQLVQVNAVKPAADLATAARSATLLVLGAALNDTSLAGLRSALTNGATVLCTPRSPAEAGTAGQLVGASITATEANVASYQMLTEIDFSHPIFSPFADPRFSDFTKIHFWKQRKLSLGTTNAHIIARFDNGDPALVQFNVGKGTLFLLASGWHPADSQLALSSKFVPMLYSLLEIGGALKAQALAFTVGDAVDVSSLRATNDLAVRKPDGTTAEIKAGQKTFAETDQPGVYSLVGVEPPFRFAVNLAPEESRTSPMGVEELEKLGVPLKVLTANATPETVRKETKLKATELESQQKLWRWLIAAALVFVVVETWVAARLSRRQSAPAA